MLVEHGAVAAHEAVLGVGLNVPLVVLHGEADVEHLAVVVHVPVVAVGLPVTAEGVVIGRAEQVLRTRGETIDRLLVLIVLGHDQGGQHAAEGDGLHDGDDAWWEGLV